MTLVLTEISPAGIAMASDSAISMPDENGHLSAIEKKEWRKLLWAPRVAAGVSYWGRIGQITLDPFDEWLNRRLKYGPYANNMPAFVDYLAAELNRANGNHVVAEPMGLHVAGYHEWGDGQGRPMFYHIHNGHGQMEQNIQANPEGVITSMEHQMVWQPRTLFQSHRDLPGMDEEIPAALQRFQNGWITRNGDFATYLVISQGLEQTCGLLRLIPGVNVPRDPNSVGGRVAYLNLLMQTVIKIHRMSSLSKGIGGEVSCLGIGPQGRYVGNV